jgi:pilus assembly protein Flp/PilA
MITTFEFLKTWITARINDERGASLVEYALLVALIAVVCIAAIGFLGGRAEQTFDRTGSAVGGVTN